MVEFSGLSSSKIMITTCTVDYLKGTNTLVINGAGEILIGDSFFRNNFAGANDGSIYLNTESSYSNATIIDSYFINNSAHFMEGAIYIASEKINLSFVNARFYGNKAQTDSNISAFPNKILVTDEIVKNDQFLKIKATYLKKDFALNNLKNKTVKPGQSLTLAFLILDKFDNILFSLNEGTITLNQFKLIK